MNLNVSNIIGEIEKIEKTAVFCQPDDAKTIDDCKNSLSEIRAFITGHTEDLLTHHFVPSDLSKRIKHVESIIEGISPAISKICEENLCPHGQLPMLEPVGWDDISRAKELKMQLVEDFFVNKNSKLNEILKINSENKILKVDCLIRLFDEIMEDIESKLPRDYQSIVKERLHPMLCILSDEVKSSLQAIYQFASKESLQANKYQLLSNFISIAERGNELEINCAFKMLSANEQEELATKLGFVDLSKARPRPTFSAFSTRSTPVFPTTPFTKWQTHSTAYNREASIVAAKEMMQNLSIENHQYLTRSRETVMQKLIEIERYLIESESVVMSRSSSSDHVASSSEGGENGLLQPLSDETFRKLSMFAQQVRRGLEEIVKTGKDVTHPRFQTELIYHIEKLCELDSVHDRKYPRVKSGDTSRGSVLNYIGLNRGIFRKLMENPLLVSQLDRFSSAHGMSHSYADEQILEVIARPGEARPDGKNPVMQSGVRGCMYGVSAMLASDALKIDVPPLFANFVDDKDIIHQLENWNLKPVQSTVETLDDLQRKIEENGSAYVSVETVGSHAIVVDCVKEDRVELRDPYHGWAVAVTREAFLESWMPRGANRKSIIQVHPFVS